MKLFKKAMWMLLLVVILITTANFLDVFIHAQTWIDFFKGLILIAVSIVTISVVVDKIQD